jgi:hypothetical protein
MPFRPSLNFGCKVLGCYIAGYIGMSHESVRTVIIKQIKEVIDTPRDEFIKVN